MARMSGEELRNLVSFDDEGRDHGAGSDDDDDDDRPEHGVMTRWSYVADDAPDQDSL